MDESGDPHAILLRDHVTSDIHRRTVFASGNKQRHSLAARVVAYTYQRLKLRREAIPTEHWPSFVGRTKRTGPNKPCTLPNENENGAEEPARKTQV